MTLDALLALGLLLSMASQLRLGSLPVGPGEICLAGWVVLTLGRGAVHHRVAMTTAFIRMLIFWVVFAAAESLGTLTGYAIRDAHDTMLFLHDVLAYPLMAAIGCLSLVGPRAEIRLHRTTWLLVAFGSLFLAPQLAAAAGFIDLPLIHPWFEDRFRGWSDNPNQLGLTCAMLVFLALHLADAASRRAERIAALACTVLPFFVGRLTKEDTFTFALIAAGPVFTVMKLRSWLSSSERRLTLRLAVALIALAGGLLMLVSIAPLAASIGGFENFGRGLMKNGGKEATSEMDLRMTLWTEALSRGLQAGMLGLGPGPHLPIPAAIATGRVSGEQDPGQVDKHPVENGTANFEAHNTMLDIFTQGGLLAVLSLIGLIAAAFFTAYRARRSGLITLICGLCLFAMTGLIIRAPMFWFAIALCLAAGEETRGGHCARARTTSRGRRPQSSPPIARIEGFSPMMAMFRCRSLLSSPPIRRIGNWLGPMGANTALEGIATLPAIRRTWRISGLVVLWITLSVPSTAIKALADDYRVHRGDVIEIGVLGSPELHRRIMVDNDGKVYFPVVGELRVAGLTLSQTRQQFRDRLAVGHVFHNPDVTINIAEYRPIYVADGAAKPGAYPYHPGMTVRDAIALAGGYGRDMPLEGIDARDQYHALLIEFVRQQIAIARLRAELAGRSEIDLAGLRTDGVLPQVLSEFVSLEAQQLKTEQDDYDKETMHLQRLIKETQEQISALTEEQAQIQSELGQQHKDAALVRGLFQRSLVPLPRVEDEQRAITSSETQLLEVRARIAQARKDLENYSRELQQQADKRKIAIMQRLETATSELATARIHLEAAGARMGYIEAESPRGLQGDSEVRDLVIFRNDEHEDQQRIAADEDTNLLPGDAIEITTSGPLSGLVSSTRGGVVAERPDPDPRHRAASAFGKGQSNGGMPLDVAARTALPPAHIAAGANCSAAGAAPLPGASPKPSAMVVCLAPTETPSENAGSATPSQPQHAASRNMGAASTIPPGSAQADRPRRWHPPRRPRAAMAE